MQLLEEFLATATVFPLDDIVIQKTIELRRIKKIKLGGAIIVATALVYDPTLLSRNTSDFSNINGLKIVNPLGFYISRYFMGGNCDLYSFKTSTRYW